MSLQSYASGHKIGIQSLQSLENTKSAKFFGISNKKV